MITYKKFASTNYDAFLDVCIWLNSNIQDLEYQKDQYKEAGNISEFKRMYYDLDLKRYKNALNRAKWYLKNSDYYNLDYCSIQNLSESAYDFICDKFGY